MNKIVVDATLIHKKNGMNVLLRGLLDELATETVPFKLLCVTTQRGIKYLPETFRLDAKVTPFLPQPIIEQFFLPVYALLKGAQAIFSPYISFPVITFGRKRIVIVHDAIYVHPLDRARRYTFRERLIRWYRGWFIKLLLTRVNQVVTISNFSKQEIIKYSGVESDLIEIIPLGVNQRLLTGTVQAWQGAMHDFFLHIAAIDKRKNTEMVVDGFVKFQTKHPEFNLVLVGKITPEVEKKIATNTAINYVGPVADEVLFGIYKSARALLYPSSFEGFGLPIIEAFANHCPVITARLSSIPEVAGDAVLYLDTLEVDSLVLAMEKIVTDTELSQTLVKKGDQRVQSYNWAVIAKQYIAIFKE